jgi:hypothetical protein
MTTPTLVYLYILTIVNNDPTTLVYFSKIWSLSTMITPTLVYFQFWRCQQWPYNGSLFFQNLTFVNNYNTNTRLFSNFYTCQQWPYNSTRFCKNSTKIWANTTIITQLKLLTFEALIKHFLKLQLWLRQQHMSSVGLSLLSTFTTLCKNFDNHHITHLATIETLISCWKCQVSKLRSMIVIGICMTYDANACYYCYNFSKNQ